MIQFPLLDHSLTYDKEHHTLTVTLQTRILYVLCDSAG